MSSSKQEQAEEDNIYIIFNETIIRSKKSRRNDIISEIENVISRAAVPYDFRLRNADENATCEFLQVWNELKTLNRIPKTIEKIKFQFELCSFDERFFECLQRCHIAPDLQIRFYEGHLLPNESNSEQLLKFMNLMSEITVDLRSFTPPNEDSKGTKECDVSLNLTKRKTTTDQDHHVICDEQTTTTTTTNPFSFMIDIQTMYSLSVLCDPAFFLAILKLPNVVQVFLACLHPPAFNHRHSRNRSNELLIKEFARGVVNELCKRPIHSVPFNLMTDWHEGLWISEIHQILEHFNTSLKLKNLTLYMDMRPDINTNDALTKAVEVMSKSIYMTYLKIVRFSFNESMMDIFLVFWRELRNVIARMMPFKILFYMPVALNPQEHRNPIQKQIEKLKNEVIAVNNRLGANENVSLMLLVWSRTSAKSGKPCITSMLPFDLFRYLHLFLF